MHAHPPFFSHLEAETQTNKAVKVMSSTAKSYSQRELKTMKIFQERQALAREKRESLKRVPHKTGEGWKPGVTTPCSPQLGPKKNIEDKVQGDPKSGETKEPRSMKTRRFAMKPSKPIL
jgi:hypothetical protein